MMGSTLTWTYDAMDALTTWLRAGVRVLRALRMSHLSPVSPLSPCTRVFVLFGCVGGVLFGSFVLCFA